jgi:hypothetical protein
MDAAARWNLPPWKVGGGSKLLWFVRFREVRDAEIRRADKIKRDLER